MTKMISMEKLAWIAGLLVIALISVFLLAPVMSSQEHHAETIASLDEKKMTAMELTAAMVGASSLVALVPGGVTDPVANQIMDLTSWLMLVAGVLFLEKFLVTVLGHAAFSYIVPIACGIGILAVLFDWQSLKRTAWKLGIFGLIIALIIPISVDISNQFDEAHRASVQEAIDSVPVENVELNTETALDQGWIDSLFSKLENGVSNLTQKGEELLNRGKEWISQFIDAVAVLVITTCVIPVGTILAAIWLAKLLFGLQLNLPRKNPLDIRKMWKR
ncbi:MAG: hypothetical protein IJ486_00405 [Firmicutes bacterium]|nr:hypothetical protein [Bacillota bacterium]